MNVFQLVGTVVVDSKPASKALATIKKNASDTANKVGNVCKNVGDGMSSIGKKLLPVTAVIGGAAAASVTLASNFEDGMAKVSTIVDTSSISLDDLSSGVMDLSNQTGVAAGDLADALYQTLSAGIDTADSLSFLGDATNLSKGGFTDATTAVDILSTAINAYGLSVDDATYLSDLLIQTQNDGKTTVDDLASSMGRVIPSASALNVGIDQLATSYAQLTKGGIDTSEATTYMNGMLTELADSGSTVAQILQEQTGQSFSELMASGDSLGDVLQILMDSSDGDTSAFKNLWGSTEAGTGALALAKGGAKGFNDELARMQGVSGNTEAALDKLETPSQKAKKAWNQIKNAGINLGQTIMTTTMPAFQGICDKIQQVTDWIKNLSEGQKRTIITILSVVAAVGPVLLIIGKVISVIGTLIPIISAVGTAALGPIALIVAAITAAIAIGVVLYQNWDIIKQKATEIFGAIADWIGAKVDAIGKFFSGLAATAKSVWTTICNVVQVGVMLVGSILSAVFQIITLPWRMAWEALKTILAPILSAIKGAVSTAFNAIKSVITTNLNAVKSVVSKVWNRIKAVILPVLNAIKSAVSKAFNGIKSVVTSIMGKIKNIISKVWNRIKSVVSSVVNAIKGVVSQAFNAIKSAVSGPLNAVKSVVSRIFNGIKNTISNVMNGAENVVSGAINKIKGFFSGLKLKFPNIKLPHFKITGKLSLSPPSVPHLSIDWYKKAMDNAMLLDKPTIFGASGGNLLAGGEAGTEVVSGANTLMRMIQQAVAVENSAVIATMRSILSAIKGVDAGLYETIVRAREDTPPKLNDREIARLVRQHA